MGCIDVATLRQWQAEAAERTLYLLDVRSPEEFEEGHIAGSRHAPGGQLVQATDRYMGTANARVVLVDDTGVRATMTASWLIQMGWTDVRVLTDGLVQMPCVAGPHIPSVPECDAVTVPTVSASELDPAAVTVVDLGTSLAYRDGHIPGAWWAIRSRLADALNRLPKSKPIVVTSGDGQQARLAAADLAALTDVEIRILDGGTDAWRAAGQPLEEGYTNLAAEKEDIYYLPYDREGTIEEAMNQYLTWEIELINQIRRDGTLVFPQFAP